MENNGVICFLAEGHSFEHPWMTVSEEEEGYVKLLDFTCSQ